MGADDVRPGGIDKLGHISVRSSQRASKKARCELSLICMYDRVISLQYQSLLNNHKYLHSIQEGAFYRLDRLLV